MSTDRAASGRVREPALTKLARACARHPWHVIGLWIALAILIIGASAGAGGTLVDEFTIPNSETQQATDLLEDRFPSRSGEAAQLVFASDSGRLDEGARLDAVNAALAAAAGSEDVVEVGDPFEGRDGALSEDGTIAFADALDNQQSFEVELSSVDAMREAVDETLEGTGVRAEYTGPVILNSEGPETGTSELLGIIAAAIILLFVFGTLVAMGLPLIMAIAAVGLGLALITLAAAVSNFNTFTPVLATMLGLAVGIDYSLFIVTRFRQALEDGLSGPDAAATATATAGRAVAFAGLTVAISLLALAVVGIDFITKMGLAASMTVFVAVLAAVTLLPALLSKLGPRVNKGRVPFIRQRDDSHEGRQRTWIAAWGRFVTGHAWLVGGASLLLLIVLALPLGWLQLGSSDAGTNPEDTTTRKAYDLLAEGFGAGFNGAFLIAVDQTGDTEAATRLVSTLRDTPGLASVADPTLNDSGDTAVVIAFPDTSPQSEATSTLVQTLRSDVVPAALDGSSARAFVGGQTAAFDDLADRIFDRFGLFLLVVIGITFLVLSMAFRSVVISVKAALTTLLSALATFGILVAVFQLGWGIGLVGLDRTGPIESFLPIIVFAILFGLSMDYEVFLVSRIREEYIGGDAAQLAIRHGMAAIGRVVVAAGTIMAVVFLSFMLGDDRIIKEFGLGLGAAIIIDAFVVRMTLVPAIMHLLNERAWYIPGWLDKLLPGITIEPKESIVRADPAVSAKAPDA
ncbi:MAG: MMPL family transporter [Gaiellaceae bacterium]